MPVRWLADRFGPRLTLTFMGVAAALFTALTAVAGRPGIGEYLGILLSFPTIRLAFGICAVAIHRSPMPPATSATLRSRVSAAIITSLLFFLAVQL